MKLQLLVLMGVATLVAAAPQGMFFGQGMHRPVIDVDCSDTQEMKRVLASNHNIRCSPGTKYMLDSFDVLPDQHVGSLDSNRINYISKNVPQYHLKKNAWYGVKDISSKFLHCGPSKVYVSELKRCINAAELRVDKNGFIGRPIVSAPFKSSRLISHSSLSCPPGFLFVSEIGQCLVANKPSFTAPLQSASLIIEQPKLETIAFSSDVHTAADCKPGEIYNSELNLCLQSNPGNKIESLQTLNLVKEKRPVALELQSFTSSINTANDCGKGEIFVSEINTCVPANPHANPSGFKSAALMAPVRHTFGLFRSGLRSASLIGSNQRDSTRRVNIIHSARDCPPGTIYVSEVGICLPANPPNVKKPLTSASFIRHPPPSVAFITEPIRCGRGTIFVPEIGICAPYTRPESIPVPPPSSSLVREPVKLEIQSFTSSHAFNNCEEGTMFLSELGICL